MNNIYMFQKCDVPFLETCQKTLTKSKSSILLVVVNGEAYVAPHKKKGDTGQDKQF